MTDLAPGASWGSFRIDRLIGRGPAGTVYRATPSAGGAPVTLKIFHETLAETVLMRFEEDTRRLLGLQAPNILRVLAVGREGGRRFLTTEAFDGRSLREIGPLPAREGCGFLLQSARAVGAAWMRLILHRNLKPENILISAAGEVKVADFGLFQEPTPYWSPERRKGQPPDMRSELFSLGTIFREALTDCPPEIDALLHHMTRVETIERVQMVEDVVSKLESFLARLAAPPPPPPPQPPPPPMAPPELVLPPMPEMPPPPVMEAPPAELKEARGSVVNALDAIADQRTLRPPPPAPRPVRPPEPPPLPPVPAAPRRRSAAASCLMVLVILGIASAMIVTRVLTLTKRTRPAPAETRRPAEKPAVPAPKTPATNDRVREDWAQTKAAIRALEEEMRYPDAGDLCERFIRRHGPKAPPESHAALSELRAWGVLVQQAETSRKQALGRRSLELLDRGGLARAKDKERILAKWCEEDWEETTRSVAQEIAAENFYRARDLIDRFLKMAHQGGVHRQEAEARKLKFVAELEFAEVESRADSLERGHKPAEAVAIWEEYLTRPHKGGDRRQEIEKQLTTLREEARRLVYGGRSTITRLVVSPDGKRIAFSADRIRVIDLASRAEVWSLSSSGMIRSMAFAGESVLVIAAPYQIAFHDLEKKAEARSIKPASGALTGLVVSRDGKRVIASKSDGALVTWDGEAEPKVEKDAAPGTTAMALSPDGKKIAMAAFREKSIRVRDLATGEEKKWSASVGSGIAIAWSPDGARLASTFADTITIWDAREGKELHSLKGHQGAVTAVAFMPDGARLASGGVDNVIRLWNLRDGSGAGTLEGQERVTGLAALPDGRLLSAGADGTVKIWSLP